MGQNSPKFSGRAGGKRRVVHATRAYMGSPAIDRHPFQQIERALRRRVTELSQHGLDTPAFGVLLPPPDRCDRKDPPDPGEPDQDKVAVGTPSRPRNSPKVR